MTTSASYERAAKREVRSIETRAAGIAHRVAVQIKRDTVRGYLQGSPVKFDAGLHSELSTHLSGALTAAYLTGMKREVMTARRHGLQLSAFDNLIHWLTRWHNKNFEGLQHRNKLRALRIAGDATGRINADLQHTIGELVASGAHVREGVRTLRQRFEQLGLAPRTKSQLETVFRTHVQIAYNAGKWRADQEPFVQELLWGYKYTTAGDVRVRPAHRELDGVTLPKDHPFWQAFWPPNGWNCRCIAVPLYAKPRKVVDAPENAEPDEGFDFNAGLVLT